MTNYKQVLAQLLLRNPHDVMFARYSPSNYRVTLKQGVGSLKVIGMAPFGSSGMTSYSRSIVTVTIAHAVCEIFAFELYSDLETRGWSHSRSLEVAPFGSLCMACYSTSIATMAVSRTVSELHQLIGQKSPSFLTVLVFGAPVRGEAIRGEANDPR